ncbi:MAG: V-type ATP synthase subunit F, partial [Thermoplasmatales archaeon]|nr:V-type ATP synthase subunit F [Candidatus Thermoplasmatota archaeon]MCG2825331.1 V-type ATP synthase subunit F [Thermoplasmatales archaeon]
MIAVIGDKDTVVGFALSGVKNGRVAENKKEAEDALKEFMETPNMHVIIITERIAELIRKEEGTWKKQKKIYPVIVEVPDKKG